jgi:hypothetical protein
MSSFPGLLMYGGFLSEPTLIGCAYDLEQDMNVRTQPQECVPCRGVSDGRGNA